MSVSKFLHIKVLYIIVVFVCIYLGFLYVKNSWQQSINDTSEFAVSVDKKAKVKTAPGAMSLFTVEKSFWVTLFRYLNIYTTSITIGVLVLTMVWLYRMKRVQEEVIA